MNGGSGRITRRNWNDVFERKVNGTRLQLAGRIHRVSVASERGIGENIYVINVIRKFVL